MEVCLRIIAVTILLFLLFLTIHLHLCTAESDVRCIQSERHALLTFKKHLQDPSNRLSSWGAAAAAHQDCCHWVGVVCHNRTGHVLQLHLRSFPPVHDRFSTDDEDQWEAFERSRFGGKIIPSLLDLKHLIYLDLSGNNFNGTQIPKFLGSMGSLRYLNLSGARFGGLIPHQLGNLSNLHYLNLEYNDLYVKNLQWLSGLPLLQHLDLSYANLSQASDWLQEINKLPSLSELRLSDCYLSSFIPPPIPSNINFSSLTTLHLSSNSFENSSTLFWVFGLHNLDSLDLSDNQFQGTIPVHLQNLTSLRHLDLSWNNFNYSIPNWLYSFRHLEFLNLGYNFYLHGTISSFIPPPIPSNINFSSLTTLDLSSNSFENSSTLFWVFGLHNLVSLDLSWNQFHGPIPVHLQNLTSLRHLDLYFNHFNSSIPNWLYSFSHLEFLSLGGNNLQGAISSAIGNLTSAISIDLPYNELEGKVPRSLGNLSNLREIRLSGNKWSQDISEIFQSLSNGLEILDLSNAKLSGQLTDELGQ